MIPGLSLGEFLLLALVAVIFLKPSDLPIVMRRAGVWAVTVRRYVHGMIAGLEE